MISVSIDLRIKELAVEADMWAQKMQWSPDPRYGDKSVSELYDYKFARLIVREFARADDNVLKHFDTE